MVKPPSPKRRQPDGCSVMLTVVPLAALAYGLTAPLAFDLLEAVYWLAVMVAAICGMMGNRVAWPLVASAYVAAGLGWQEVEFTPLRWVAIDLAAIAGIVGLRWWEYRKSDASTFFDLHRTDWAIIVLFFPCWLLYTRPDYFRYVAIVAIVTAQMILTVPVAVAHWRALTTERQERKSRPRG